MFRNKIVLLSTTLLLALLAYGIFSYSDGGYFRKEVSEEDRSGFSGTNIVPAREQFVSDDRGAGVMNPESAGKQLNREQLARFGAIGDLSGKRTEKRGEEGGQASLTGEELVSLAARLPEGFSPELDRVARVARIDALASPSLVDREEAIKTISRFLPEAVRRKLPPSYASGEPSLPLGSSSTEINLSSTEINLSSPEIKKVLKMIPEKLRKKLGVPANAVAIDPSQNADPMTRVRDLSKSQKELLGQITGVSLGD